MPEENPAEKRRPGTRATGRPSAALAEIQGKRELTEESLSDVKAILASMYDKSAPTLYRSIALFLFYLLHANKTDKNRAKISGEDIASCINRGARYFLGGEYGDDRDIDEWRVRSFATRKSALPEASAEFFELTRLLALTYEADPRLQKDPFVSEIVSGDHGFDFPKAYKLARRGDIVGARSVVAAAKARSATSRSFHADLVHELGLRKEDGGFLRRLFFGNGTDQEEQIARFRTYRLGSAAGEVVVSMVDVHPLVDDNGQMVDELLRFETQSLDRGGRRRISRGYVFYVPHTGVYFVGAVSGMGLNFVVLPHPLANDEGALAGLVITPDNRRTGRPVASRIEFLRCPAEIGSSEEVEFGPVSLDKLPAWLAKNIETRVDFRLRNRVSVTLPVSDILPSVVERQFVEYDDLISETGVWLDSMDGSIAPKKNPFSGGGALRINPFERSNFLFDRALICAKDET